MILFIMKITLSLLALLSVSFLAGCGAGTQLTIAGFRSRTGSPPRTKRGLPELISPLDLTSVESALFLTHLYGALCPAKE
jgi:hypothetical protein